MDISYLLALQDLRLSLPSPVETFFVLLSYIGDGPALVALMLVVYWCIDKRMGLFAFTAFSMGNFANQLIKNIACVYRPWIRDAAVTPAAASIEGAGGYSFPSGHTTGTTTSLGSFAWLLRRKRKGIAALCIAVVVLIAFSRNFLGVHTPQDVVVGFLLALASIALTQAFFNWMERLDAFAPGHNRDIAVAAAVIALSIASVAFVLLKPYPMDYVDGVLVVDPVSMQKGSFEAAGIFIGLALGWVLERRFVGFSTEGLDLRARLTRFAVGVALIGVTYVATDVVFKAVLPYNWAKLFAMLVVVFVAIFVVPLVFKTVERRGRRNG